MADDDTTARADLPAGRFSTWLVQIGSVPCDTCTACCTSSQFVHIGPDETETLARIPRALLFPAPGLPRGNVVLGYDERGHCPMFVDGRCSIYAHRPRTCRTYDCRVLPAAGLDGDEDGKPAIAERIRRWRFDYVERRDQALHDAVRAAAAFLRGHAAEWPAGLVPRGATQLAYLAVQVHDLFLTADGQAAQPSVDAVAAAVRRLRRGDTRKPAV